MFSLFSSHCRPRRRVRGKDSESGGALAGGSNDSNLCMNNATMQADLCTDNTFFLLQTFLFFSTLIAFSRAATVAVAGPVLAAAPHLVRAPAHDSASIEHHRLGGNFAYSTAEAHAFAEVVPQISTLTHPVAETTHTQ